VGEKKWMPQDEEPYTWLLGRGSEDAVEVGDLLYREIDKL
jgi:hypothetical protein